MAFFSSAKAEYLKWITYREQRITWFMAMVSRKFKNRL